MKTVLITGGASGIGAALSYLFAKNGWRTVIHYHTSKVAALALSCELNAAGYHTITVQAELSNEEEVKTLFSQIGTVHCLINNAGIALSGLLQDFTGADFDRIFNVNMKSAFLATKEALPGMIHDQHGVIINISSIWGLCGASTEVLYSASKAALIGFTKALAKEVGPSGIRVNCIAPGVIDTKMNQQLSAEDLACLKDETPLGTIGTPEDVANLALFLATDQASFITGQVISPNGGFVI